jgi:hypothetical protein
LTQVPDKPENIVDPEIAGKLAEIGPLVEELRAHFLELSETTNDPKMRGEIKEFLASYATAHQDFVKACQQMDAEADAMAAESKELGAQAEALRKQAEEEAAAAPAAPTPAAPDEELGPRLREEVLRRYIWPAAAVAAEPALDGREVWELSSREYRPEDLAAAEAEPPKSTEAKQTPPAPAKGPAKPPPKAKPPDKEDEVWDMTSGDWKKDE